jgi:predicted nucleic acid-binding protein
MAGPELRRDAKEPSDAPYVLDYENAPNPFAERRESIARWRALAVQRVLETEAGRTLARQLASSGIKPYDALHAACAVTGGAALFVSTDDALLKRPKASSSLKAFLPGEALAIVENWYED